jgi:hypothetical protein
MRNSRDVAIQTCGAVIQQNGSYITLKKIILWFNEHGQLHRENGPAIIYPNSRPMFYYNDHPISSFNEWIKLTPISDESKMLLRLQYA